LGSQSAGVDFYFPSQTTPYFSLRGDAQRFGVILKKCCFSALVLAISPALASAQQALSPIVVTSTRAPSSAEAQSRDITLISQEDIAASGASSIAELLRGVGGTQIVQYGSGGATSGVFLRGANSNHTLVLIDGQRVGSSTAGLTALEAISPANIERIEIVRGPLSMLYGADALGGVIQIFTRSGAGNRSGASLAVGTQKSVRANAFAAFDEGIWSTQLSGNFERSAGFNAIDHPKNFSYNPDADGFRRFGGNAAISAQIAPQVLATLRLLHNDLNTQYDGSATYDDRTRTTQSAVQATLDLHGTTLRLGQSEDDARFDSEFPGAFRTRTSEASAQHRFALAQGWSLLGALEWRGERVTTSEGFAVNQRNTTSALASLNGTVANAGLHATARIDDSKQFGSRLTGGFGLVAPLASALQLVANIGTAFKAPTFNDLYYPGFSNPNLKPERALSADIGLRLKSGALSGSIVGHQARIRDIIVFECDAEFNCAPQNVNRASISGVTLATQWQISGQTQLNASLDFLNAKDQATGTQLPRRARTHGSVRLQHAFAGITARAEVIAVGKRFDDGANKNPLAAYSLVNLGVDVPLAKGLSAELRANNVADEHYALAKDFASAPRSFMVGLRWQQ
jgi:vitamin B12 transporter